MAPLRAGVGVAIGGVCLAGVLAWLLGSGDPTSVFVGPLPGPRWLRPLLLLGIAILAAHTVQARFRPRPRGGVDHQRRRTGDDIACALLTLGLGAACLLGMTACPPPLATSPWLLAVATVLVGLPGRTLHGAPARRLPMTAAITVTAGGVLALVPLTEMAWYLVHHPTASGRAIVVFGARACADGTPSDALADRTRWAAALYRQGRAPRIICSGGPGDGDIHESVSMHRLLRSLEVPEDAIALDLLGVNSWATVLGVAAAHGADDRAEPFLMVSHVFHLPRIMVTCDRLGVPARAAPARHTRMRRLLPWAIAREIPGFWVYALRPPPRDGHPPPAPAP